MGFCEEQALEADIMALLLFFFASCNCLAKRACWCGVTPCDPLPDALYCNTGSNATTSPVQSTY